MTQIVITKAANGFVVEVRNGGQNVVNVASNLAQVVKQVKAAYDEPAETE